MPAWWHKVRGTTCDCDVALGYYEGDLSTSPVRPPQSTWWPSRLLWDWRLGCVYSRQMPDKGMIWDHMPFKMYELFTSEIFILTFSDRGWLQVTGSLKSKTADTGDDCIRYIHRIPQKQRGTVPVLPKSLANLLRSDFTDQGRLQPGL